MGLKAAICTQCGAQIEVDESREAGICKFCGTAFVTETVINQYNVVHNHNNYISAQKINVGAESADELAETGMKLINARRYDQAEAFFTRIRENYPSDYRGWWGQFLCETESGNAIHKFTSKNNEIFESMLWKQLKYVDNACALATKSKAKEMISFYKNFENKLEAEQSMLQNELMRKMRYEEEKKRKEEEQRRKEEEQRQREEEQRRKEEEKRRIMEETDREFINVGIGCLGLVVKVLFVLFICFLILCLLLFFV